MQHPKITIMMCRRLLRLPMIRARVGGIPTGHKVPSIFLQQSFTLFTSPIHSSKDRAGANKDHLKNRVAVPKLPTEPPEKDEILADAYRRMKAISEQLNEELAKHFSLTVDPQIYENCKVTLENGEFHSMNHLGEVSMRNPHTIAINFMNNPSAIKAAKTALMESALCANPVQDGVMLYVEVPRTSRERRESLSRDAKKILNDHNKALNLVYSQYDKRNTSKEKLEDEKKQRRIRLLDLKNSFEALGSQRLDHRRAEFLREEIA